MQVQNFECQIAKAQIGRFLAGDALADDVVEQLETHIAKCASCKQNLAERRAALQALLFSPEPAADEEPVPEQEPSPRRPFPFKLPALAVVRDTLGATSPSKVPPPAGDFKKPALYAAALAIVLVGMSYASKNMNGVMGPKAAESLAAGTVTPQAEPRAWEKSKPEPKQTSSAPVANPASKGEPGNSGFTKPPDSQKTGATPQSPLVEVARSPIPSRPNRAKPRKTKHKNSKRVSETREPGNSIRVYAPTE